MRTFRLLNLVMLLSLLLAACGTPAATASSVKPAATEAPATAAPAATQAAAPDPYGKYETPITLTSVRSFETNEKLPDGDTPENNQYTRYVKDNLNIDVQYIWTSSTADYEQK